MVGLVLIALMNIQVLAYFSTNLSGHSIKNNNRKMLLITDERASLPFYMTHLISEKKRLTPLMETLKDLWPK
ncbi:MULTISPECIES: hypothetical protein [unclassified Streptococcus]|uniref:hypothetical protein n=1 Tax=unclassified Streptococcus TaxID=2608887 RepID=UPI00359D1AE8